jgi:MYXO-CTERM domain-containing protein
MEPWMIRILCAALAAVLLGVIVLRRRRSKAE